MWIPRIWKWSGNTCFFNLLYQVLINSCRRKGYNGRVRFFNPSSWNVSGLTQQTEMRRQPSQMQERTLQWETESSTLEHFQVANLWTKRKGQWPYLEGALCGCSRVWRKGTVLLVEWILFISPGWSKLSSLNTELVNTQTVDILYMHLILRTCTKFICLLIVMRKRGQKSAESATLVSMTWSNMFVNMDWNVLQQKSVLLLSCYYILSYLLLVKANCNQGCID